MKMIRILFMFALVFAVGTSYGQVKVIADGNVGIGVDNPDCKLAVQGVIKALHSNGTSSLSLELPNVTNGQINKVTDAGQALIDISPIVNDGTSNASFRFFRQTNTTGLAKFDVHVGNGTSQVNCRVSGNGNSFTNNIVGNFGIGLTNGTEKLHVIGNGLFTGTVTANGVVLSLQDGTTVSLMDIIDDQQTVITEMRAQLDAMQETVELLQASTND